MSPPTAPSPDAVIARAQSLLVLLDALIPMWRSALAEDDNNEEAKTRVVQCWTCAETTRDLLGLVERLQAEVARLRSRTHE